MQNIKDCILNEKDVNFFGIEMDDTIKKTYMYKNGKSISTNDPDFVELDKIDKIKYFNVYFKDFLNSIFQEAFCNE